jgi:C-terminal processing protease CtpA/Prc
MKTRLLVSLLTLAALLARAEEPKGIRPETSDPQARRLVSAVSDAEEKVRHQPDQMGATAVPGPTPAGVGAHGAGIGVALAKEGQYLVIKSIFPNSPAAATGGLKGDQQ